MRNKFSIRHIFFTLFICLMLSSYGEVFEFKHHTGDKYRAVTEVKETVIRGDRFGNDSYKTDILNKISFTVEEAQENRALISGNFVISERNITTGNAYAVTDSYPSRYWLSKNGEMSIEPQYLMPTVRNIPVFPDRDLKPGDTWVFKGEEVHDFRDSDFPLSVARIPITAAYTYVGTEEYEGVEYHIITVEYTVYVQLQNDRSAGYTRIAAHSSQKLFWDMNVGRHIRVEDNFDFRWDLYDGSWVEFRGNSVGRIIEAELMDKQRVADEIRESLSDVKDTEVRVDDEGVTIALQNIQFAPDSFILLNSERAKIRRIAEILKAYPSRDILVGGHTALAGTPEGRMELSVNRARAVADYLIRLGARKDTEIMIRGFGATKPVATNTTEEGKILNRRVEITILEN